MNTSKGTWLVLTGLILYLCEFVAMALAGGYPSNTPLTPLTEIPATYEGFENGAGYLVGWMALALSGRILIVLGFRKAFGPSPLLDWAVALMSVSVALEVAAVGLLAGTAGLVADGVDADAVLALDRAAWFVGSGVTAPVGLAVLLCAAAMWRHGDLSRLLAGIGVLTGATTLLSGLLTAPSTYPLASALSTAVIVWWAWTLWVGIVLARRAGLPAAERRRPVERDAHDRGTVVDGAGQPDRLG
ncbi:hypothetical protein [Ornithinimicrobium avium]|uniref:DUF4386 domain-containing protein n=1 Tax=Ornithinimicrobium avium TaxID=2283195 RepID=A0A345NQV3_9MICO|nr:hypothetical protein [Ornithinimicrobium avium]AXH97411.1 hypothetical protein DV701_16000 [Ornithinimicrobium avium]